MSDKQPTGPNEAEQRHSTPQPPPVTLEVHDAILSVAAPVPATDQPKPINHWANMPEDSTDARVNDPNNPRP